MAQLLLWAIFKVHKNSQVTDLHSDVLRSGEYYSKNLGVDNFLRHCIKFQASKNYEKNMKNTFKKYIFLSYYKKPCMPNNKSAIRNSFKHVLFSLICIMYACKNAYTFVFFQNLHRKNNLYEGNAYRSCIDWRYLNMFETKG